MQHPSPPAQEKRFFGHPLQLSTLFHIELWERFSFYGMQGILLIYLYYAVKDGGLGIDQGLAGGIVGAYSASVYLATILGGWLADRVLGAERTLFYSGVVVMLGHMALAIVPGALGLGIGMVLIALGSGGVKSAASSMVGALYEEESLRPLRDAGFSIFYISINIGGFFGPLLTGLAQTQLGFHYGFGLAALGMAFGLWRYQRGRKLLPASPPPNPLAPQQRARYALIGGVIVVLLLGCVLTGVLHTGNYPQLLLGVNLLAIIGYFGYLLTGSSFSREEKQHVLAYLPLFIATVIFWMLWFQVFTSVVVYFDETVDRVYGSFTVPVSWSASLQSFWVILFSGLMAAMWTRMGERQPRTPLKFALALLCTALGYYIFVPYIQQGVAMPVAMFALVILILTIAELLNSPIALSFVTKIAPSSFKTQMVALHFLSLAMGFAAGGKLFELGYSADRAADFYWLLTVTGVVSGVVLLALVPVLNRMLKGVD